MPNQDAVLVRQYPFGFVLAVADGIGSDKNSEYASMSAVSAVHDVFSTITVDEIEHVSEKMSARFTELMSEAPMKEAGTTCIFCAHTETLGLVLGQIGDGICCGRIEDQPFILKEKDSEFSNIVEPLSVAHMPCEWTVVQYRGVSKVKLMLATDGIADDIIPGKEIAFSDYLLSAIEALPDDEKENKLREIIDKWETPNSNDDKTIALYSYE